MRLAPAPEQEEEPGQFWKDFIRETAPVFRKSTFEQLEEFIAPTWEALLDGARYVDERLAEIFDELQPDAIVEDNVCAFPAIPASGLPWVRIASCNPLEMKDPELPPTFSGLPLEDRSEWEAFRAEYARTTGDMQSDFSEFCVERGAPPLPDGEMIHSSERLNLYLYPEAVDYPRSRPLGETWHNLGSCVRATDEAWDPPAEVAEGEGSLIYVSLGSLGSGDVPLMERLVESLGKTRHRYVVSKGPQHEEYELAPNMVGAEFLPQVSVLPKVDLVITHAGQQHDHRVPALRQADDRAAAVLGPARQRAADRRDRVRPQARHLWLRRRGDLGGDRRAARRRSSSRSGFGSVSSKLQASPGTERAADLIETRLNRRLRLRSEPAV